jgi:hypothetical protein
VWLRVFRVDESCQEKDIPDELCVVVLASGVPDNAADAIKTRLPRAMIIAEVRRGESPRRGFFNVLRIPYDELDAYDYDIGGCRAIIIERVIGLFQAEIDALRARVAKRAGIPQNRVRVCQAGDCGGDYGCYTARALREYACELGIDEFYVTAKQEYSLAGSQCTCVKSSHDENV